MPIQDVKVSRQIIEGRITPKAQCYSENEQEPIFLRAQNIDEGFLNLSDAKRIKRDVFESEKKAILNDGDIVFTIDGVLLGIAAVYYDTYELSCISNHMVRILQGTETNPEFLSWFLNSPLGQKQIKRGITGSAIPGIRTDAIERILVPLPPIEVQKSLVAEIEAARQNKKQKLAQAEELLSSINNVFLDKLELATLSKIKNREDTNKNVFSIYRKSICKRLDTFYYRPEFNLLQKELLKQKDKLLSLRNLALSFTNGDHGGVKYKDSGIRYLRGQNITKEGLDLSDEKYISIETHQKMMRSEVILGDVLLTIAGTIGNCCVVKDLNTANINQAIVKIRPTEKIDSDYLAEFLNSDYGKFQTTRLANGGVQLNINFSEVGDIQVLVPDLDIQKSITQEIKNIRSQARTLKQQAELEWKTAKTRFEQKLLGEET